MDQELVPCLCSVQMLVLSFCPDVQSHLSPFHLCPCWSAGQWSSWTTGQGETEAGSMWEFWDLSRVGVEREGGPFWMSDWPSGWAGEQMTNPWLE